MQHTLGLEQKKANPYSGGRLQLIRINRSLSRDSLLWQKWYDKSLVKGAIKCGFHAQTQAQAFDFHLHCTRTEEGTFMRLWRLTMENEVWCIAYQVANASEDLVTLSVDMSLETYKNKVVEVGEGVMGVWPESRVIAQSTEVLKVLERAQGIQES